MGIFWFEKVKTNKSPTKKKHLYSINRHKGTDITEKYFYDWKSYYDLHRVNQVLKSKLSIFIFVSMKNNNQGTELSVRYSGNCFVIQSQYTRVWKGLEFYSLIQKSCFSAFLFNIPSSLLTVIFLLSHSHTHTVSLSVQSTKRGQWRSMSVTQVVTQMMTNWPPLCSPPNQVQTWLLCTHSSCKWRSMEFRWSSLPLGQATALSLLPYVKSARSQKTEFILVYVWAECCFKHLFPWNMSVQTPFDKTSVIFESTCCQASFLLMQSTLQRYNQERASTFFSDLA